MKKKPTINPKDNPVIKEFSRFASHYQNYNIVQTQVASFLAQYIQKHHCSEILDIGCGNGVLYNKLKKLSVNIEKYYALDISSSKLKLHPNAKEIQKLQLDFNDKDFISKLPFFHIDTIVSSSALQWSNNLENLFDNLSLLSDNIFVAIFTSNTFKTLHDIASIISPIHSKEHILYTSKKFHKPLYHITKKYKLYFECKKDMFTYIKKSGVSGGERRLSYQQTKALINSYPYDYLEFEVIFLSTYNLKEDTNPLLKTTIN